MLFTGHISTQKNVFVKHLWITIKRTYTQAFFNVAKAKKVYNL